MWSVINKNGNYFANTLLNIEHFSKQLPILQMTKCRSFIDYALDDNKQICAGYDKQNLGFIFKIT